MTELLKTGDATIVDVRTTDEFMDGHISGSLNIPLHEIPQRLAEFKEMKNIILCCAAGGRSSQATIYLKRNGIECENGGSWMDINSFN